MSASASPKLELSSIDIERIVREVLASISPANTSANTSANAAANAAMNVPVIPSEPTAAAVDIMHITESVLSMGSLRDLPSTTKQITVASTTLVTPAAKDWLREKRIGWTRIVQVSPSASQAEVSQKNNLNSALKPVLVTGSVLWLRTLEKQLCPKSAQVDQVQIDDAASIRAVAQAIRSGTPAAIAVVKAPHATHWQAARDEVLRPSIVAQWSDLAEVLKEVPTNMLILSANRWNIAGTANIARKFIEHIQANR
jgi:hypothetical protein